jgi:type I restriction enzyme R subunit
MIQGLLAFDTLLDLLRTCTVFMDTDAGKRVKVVCRYQQYRAARHSNGCALGKRLRRSGVWHTRARQISHYGLRRPDAPRLFRSGRL